MWCLGWLSASFGAVIIIGIYLTDGAAGLDCRSNLRGGSYTGHVSITRSGLPCQRWDSQFPHKHNVSSTMLPDKGGLTEASNYCRSPDFAVGGPWCYTMTAETVWEYCDIPVCDEAGCMDTPNGVGYIGSTSTTVTNSSCKKWSEILIFTPYGFLPYGSVRFADGQTEHSKCRNLEGERDGPWCESSHPEYEWEYCHVKLCERQYSSSIEKSLLPDRQCTELGGTCTQQNCCKDEHYVTGLCASHHQICCLSSVDCSWKPTEVHWPSGSYILPKTVFGCPQDEYERWKNGYMTLGSGTGTGSLSDVVVTWSDTFHLAGPYNPGHVTMRMCERRERYAPASLASWPPGNYCLLRAGGLPCPSGFRELDYEITLTGLQASTTVAYATPCDVDATRFCVSFCCRENENYRDIKLPTSNPFILFKAGDVCQSVQGMSYTEEHMKVSLGNGSTFNTPSGDDGPLSFSENKLTFNLCYYQRNDVETCYHEKDRGVWYRGEVNVTSLGPCSPWQDIARIDHYKHYHHVGIDNNNFCRNTILFQFEEEPWCYATGQKALCGIPPCDESEYADTIDIGKGRPARQKHGEISEAQLVVDGNILTCSSQSEISAWWQVDLQGVYSVMAISVLRHNVDLCVLRFMNIHVDMDSEGFHDNSGLLCGRNLTMASMEAVYTRCVQPVVGQYVTLDNLVYIESETYTEDYEKCLIICEVVVHVKDTNCGRRLLERTISNQIEPYIVDSTGHDGLASLYTLHSSQSWCLPQTPHMWLMINLLYPRRLQGLVTQPTVDGTEHVAEFNLLYGFNEKDLIYYQEYPGIPKLFRITPMQVTPESHHFLEYISASVIRLDIQPTTSVRQCLRLDVLGCITEYDDLVKPGLIEQSSEGLRSVPASLSSDNDVTSCPSTLSEMNSWWRLHLLQKTMIHSVVIQTGIPFGWNLAGGRPTDALDQPWSGYSWRANDGNKEATNYWHGSCSHTNFHDHPWWAVDLGNQYNVTVVMVTNRADCCYNRLDKFVVLVGDMLPEAGESINVEDYATCAVHDENFPAGGTVWMRCEPAGITGRYVVIVIPGEDFLTLCEVQVLGHRDPFVISVDPGDSSSSSSCESQNGVWLGGHTHVFNCDNAASGRQLSAGIEGLGPMSVCEALVYGGLPADIEQTDISGRESVILHCGTQGTSLLLKTLSEPSTDREMVYVLRAEHHLVTGQCEGRQTCHLPLVEQTETEEVIPMSVLCAFSQTREEKCQLTLTGEGRIETPNYPYYYGPDLECYWRVDLPEGFYVSLNVSTISLPGPVSPLKDGCLEYNLGVCTDSAYVQYSDNEEVLSVSQASLFISSTNSLLLSLSSCYRRPPDVTTGKYGLQATVSKEECGGCSIQKQTSSVTCRGDCGHVVSFGFPSGYPANLRQEWLIIVDSEKFISLTFVDFDVHEFILSPCEKDQVIVYDMDLLGRRTSSLIFCNSNPPRSSITSSWYQMTIEFVTDSEYSTAGFHAVYQQRTYEPTEELVIQDGHSDCPSEWLHFEGNCYLLFVAPEPIVWQNAESRCNSHRGHLVSIANHREMAFLHFMLSTRWRTNDTSSFIGLTDHGDEGRWRWSDGSPLTYSAWSPSSSYSTGNSNIRQPDGAEVEDCGMILLDSIHSTDSWHDIPCAYDQVKQYLCEIDIGSRGLMKPTGVDVELEVVPSHLMMCDNGEMVLAQAWCDNNPDCRDSTDELNCTQDEGYCWTGNFECLDGSCISISQYCDFEINCPDGSDELGCVRPNCSDSEFTCDNGQCIAAARRCDLLADCQDSSDEEQCVKCSGDVAFQCFDGTCISMTKRCDGVVDCPGSLHEDESEDCTREAIQPSCQDWKLTGRTETGKYLINPGGSGSFEVECDYTSHVETVTTVHHDSESRIYVTGYPNPGQYLHYLHYSSTYTQIKAMKLHVERCEQAVKLECFGAAGTKNDFWLNIEGERIPWLTTSDSQCKCSLTEACEQNRSRCWCEDSDTNVPRVMMIDSGHLSTLSDLPMTAISLSGTSFKDQQYQYHTVGPLVCYQGGNETRDEIRCSSGHFIARHHLCIKDVDQYNNALGCRDASHLEDCAGFSCPRNLFKCPDSYCLPLRMLCDGSRDCLNGEDEYQCDTYRCPGMYKCSSSTNCIEVQQVCDGQRQCRLGEDEATCDLTCPPGCHCVGFLFNCPSANFTSIRQAFPKQLRRLDLTGNKVNLTKSDFVDFPFLGELLLANNEVSDLQPFLFSKLYNLYHLDLSFNKLVILKQDTFYGLARLTSLNLKGNSDLIKVEVGTFSGLIMLPSLDLRGLNMEEIEPGAFQGLPSLVNLDLSMNQLVDLSPGVFSGLDQLQSLNLSDNPGDAYLRATFDDLSHLQHLQSDYFKYCCFVSDKVSEENCLPKRDELSSCEDLMRRTVLQAFLWILGLMALICNAFVLIWRSRETMNVYSFSVFNLAFADLLMGLYMVILASVDTYYRGVYIEYSDSWRRSWLCQILGFLNTISSEASVFILCLISGDRFYNIVFPFRAMRSGKAGLGKVRLIMALVWALAFLIAVLPIFPLDYFQGSYYSRSGMCISIHLTNELSPGWEFSVAIFHGMNFSCFMFIFMSYAYMYRVVVMSSRSASGKKASDAEIKLARRITLVVATDFLCWVPINIMGAAAMGGVRIPGEVYAWVVVFLLPVNSAINPLLYTISAINLIKKSKSAKAPTTVTESLTNNLVYVHAPQSSVSLKELLSQSDQLDLRLAHRLLVALTRVVSEAHDNHRILGNLDVGNLVVFKTGKQYEVGVKTSQPVVAMATSFTEDVADLGKVFSYILRRCAVNR